ncbi:hypothetical protein BDQ17DRAFT_1360491 [Cyathus striatus]|nr:hypothetical protein BDQ17DRAFT_1360491 [Cyathus striatus]
MGRSHYVVEIPSSKVVDLQTEASRLACQLGCLTHFLSAAAELHSCSLLLTRDFYRHSRKIIVLIEIARKCLSAANIQPYSFSSCPPSLLPYKEAYTKLLNMLRDMQHCIDQSIKERVQRLLVPLSTGLQVCRKGDCVPLLHPAALMSTHRECSHSPQIRTPFPNVTPPSFNMPPPDAFPLSPEKGKIPPVNIRHEHTRLWDPEEIRESPRKKRRRAPSPKMELEQENVAPLSYLLRPLPRKFGIFCTSKNSMHNTNERVGRATTVRSLIKE